MREAAELKPRGVGEQLDLGFNLYFRNFLPFARTAAMIIAPVAALSILVMLLALQADPADDPGFVDLGDTRAAVHYGYYTAALIAGGVLQLLATLLVTAAVMKSVADAYRGLEVRPADSFKAGFKKLHSLIWIIFLMLLAFTVVGVLGIIFFPIWLVLVYFYVAWSLAVPVLVVEGIKGSKALGRSLTLIDKSWWRTFGVYLVGFIVYGFVLFLGTLLADAIGTSLDNLDTFEVLSGVITAVLQIATAPFIATLIAVVYFDNRVRKDGLDIEAMAGNLEGEAPATGTAGTGA